jgi:hypothetical protein
MAHRWGVVLAALALAIGSALAPGVVSASSLPRIVPAHVYPGHTMIPSGATGAATRPRVSSGTLNVIRSSNWSGYAAHLPRRHAFRSVSASWTQPRARCGHSAGKHQFAAFWVGLGGYNSTSVEQTGTDSDCVGTTPHYYGWFEMFPAAPVDFKNLVRPGDHMSASVTFSGVAKYTLVLTDATRHWRHAIVRRKATLGRSSAEVITEAPSSGTTGAVLPLADFGTVRFSLIRVNGLILNRETPSRIVMYDRSGLPKDSTGPLGNAGGAFRNAWLRGT